MTTFHIEPMLPWDPSDSCNADLDVVTPGVMWRAYGNTCGINFEKWQIEKVTPTGMWLEHYGRRTWRNSATTRYVRDTKRKAVQDLLRRRRWWLRACERRLEDARYIEAQVSKYLGVASSEALLLPPAPAEHP